MDFAEYKKRCCSVKADTRNPWMGLNGKICEKPVYWCRLHEVWLSEEDVAQKKCFSRMTPDMLSTRKCNCNCIEKRDKNPFIREE